MELGEASGEEVVRRFKRARTTSVGPLLDSLAALAKVIAPIDGKNRPSIRIFLHNDARLVAVVHDEVVVEVNAEDALHLKAMVEKALVDAMPRVFPGATTNGLVEVSVGQTWAEK
jgi:DNA polymerase I-like protein with 3'-5' exonuclease and polymerase domains